MLSVAVLSVAAEQVRRTLIIVPNKTGSTIAPHCKTPGRSDKCASGAKTTITLPKEATAIGTWNARSLHACGKAQELTHQLKGYRWDILGLAEVRWTLFGQTTTDEGHKIWYCGEVS